MRIFWLLLCLGLVSLQVGSSALRLSEDHRQIDAQEQMRRLALVAQKIATHGKVPAGPAFWAAIGRTGPFLDPWGMAYILEPVGGGELQWRSAGPDQKYQTKDDLLTPVPRPVPEFTRPPMDSDTPMSMDAI